ncbi:hypothetical protein SDC9_76926 [bioreactor metagenome]|uniref:Uncharacterized protein n=1 Tax=bioreactor metagenome TaxID=1076179 RepID=A0A644YQV3_9ZZZZ
MVRISCQTEPDQFCIDPGSAFYRMIIIFQNKTGTTFAKHKAITVLIERT